MAYYDRSIDISTTGRPQTPDAARSNLEHGDSSTYSRRQLLLGASTLLGLSGAGVLVAARAETPLRLRQPRVVSARPTGPRYVALETLQSEDQSIGNDLRRATERLRITGRQHLCLTLPNGVFSVPDFTDGFQAGLRVWNRGIVGSGPATVVQVAAMRNPPANPPGPVMFSQIQCLDVDAEIEFSDFTIAGFDQHGLAYNGLQIGASPARAGAKRPRVLRLYSDARNPGWRGSKNVPPAEAGFVNLTHCDDAEISLLSIDCRNSKGVRKATSPLMLNHCARPTVSDCYFHHAVAGMPTAYRCSDVRWLRVRSEHNGSGRGRLNGAAFNHELCTGTVVLRDCAFVVDRASGNTGLHLSVASSEASCRVSVVNPTFDRGPWPGWFSVQSVGYEPELQRQSDIQVTDAIGNPIRFRVSR